jgi:pheromone shutdown-related protein TraB
MYVFKNIYLVGSSHIAKGSVQEVKDGVESIHPEIIALELDSGRAYALKHKVRRPKNFDLLRSLGFAGFMFYLFGEFAQKSLGKIVELDPGSEMKEGMRIAEEKKLILVLIDRDIQITLSRFSKYFRKREVLKIIWDIVTGIFKKEKMQIDLSKAPSEELIEMVVTEVKGKYPSLFKILIDERDLFMAKNLHALSFLHPDKKIFAVVGAGHIKGILKYLEEMKETAVKTA